MGSKHCPRTAHLLIPILHDGDKKKTFSSRCETFEAISDAVALEKNYSFLHDSPANLLRKGRLRIFKGVSLFLIPRDAQFTIS